MKAVKPIIHECSLDDMKNILGKTSQIAFQGLVLSEDELVARQLRTGDIVAYRIGDSCYPVAKLSDVTYLRATDPIHTKEFN